MKSRWRELVARKGEKRVRVSEGNKGKIERECGKVARFTRVVSRHPLANYDSICISSNKSRLLVAPFSTYTTTCFPGNSSSPYLMTGNVAYL